MQLYRGVFKQVFDWHFDKRRVKYREAVTKKRKPEQIREMVDMKLLDHDLELSDETDFLTLFFPCFGEHVPTIALDFYHVLNSAISLEGGGMGGVSFRDTKNGIMSVLEKNGYCGVITAPIVEDFENRMLKQHFENTKVK